MGGARLSGAHARREATLMVMATSRATAPLGTQGRNRMQSRHFPGRIDSGKDAKK